MADVDSTLRLWSGTASSNKPTGATPIGTGLDDNIRQIQATVRQFLASPGSTVASAATIDLSTADGRQIPLSGTSTVVGLGTESAGIEYLLTTVGSLVFKNSSALMLPGGADFTSTANDYLLAVSKGAGNWAVPWTTQGIQERLDSKFRIVGSGDATKKLAFEVDGFTTATTRTVTFPDADLTLAAILAKGDIQAGTGSGVMAALTAGADGAVLTNDSAQATGLAWRAKFSQSSVVASTSGTSIDFTGIPTWAKRVKINFSGVSLSASADFLIQVGSSGGGIKTSGYLGASAAMPNAGANVATNYTTGFGIFVRNATTVVHGAMTLSLMDATNNIWISEHSVGFSNGPTAAVGGASVNLAAVLDRVRITTTSTDTFDAGSISVVYE